MEWGIPTLLEIPDPENAAMLCQELGFSFVELNLNLPEYQQLDVSLLKSIAERYGIYFTIHLDENLDVCDFNTRVADAYLQTMLDTIVAARQIGAPIINMHMQPGVYFTLPEGKVYLYNRYLDHYKARLARAIAQCEKAAAGADLKICVENTNGYGQQFLQEGLALLLQSPLFALTYDIGHDHGAGGIDKLFILGHQDRLRHFHIHDALGKKNHLPLGSGELDLSWYICLAEKQQCRAVLEVKTVDSLKNSAAWLRAHCLF